MNTAAVKKKIAFPLIAIALLIALVGGVFYALAFAKDTLENAIGGVGGVQGVLVKFELQRARDLGVVDPQ